MEMKKAGDEGKVAATHFDAGGSKILKRSFGEITIHDRLSYSAPHIF